MSQILRAMKLEFTQICHFCAGRQRETGSHYETLGVARNASQRDIRLAFLKLSKEMHPDTSKNKNHTQFVKIYEAYKVLGKTHTRQQYDSHLRFERGPRGHPVRVVYYEGERNPYGAENWQNSSSSEQPKYGNEKKKRMTNVTIAMLCLVVSAVGFAVQMTMIHTSATLNRERLMAESRKNAKIYRQLRERASRLTREEQIALYKQQRDAGKESSQREGNFVER